MRFHTIIALLAGTLLFPTCKTQQNKVSNELSFDQYPVYHGSDLGIIYTPAQTRFRLWSPAVEDARFYLYAAGEGGKPLSTHSLKKAEAGTWLLELPGDHKGQFYTVQVKYRGKWLQETADPYAKAVGVNGKRGMILDLSETHPKGWEKDEKPPLRQFTDIILYELHVRDLSSHVHSGIQNKGKFLGLTERGTKNAEGLSTGLDHLKELGVTHLHLLPAFDYRYTSVDESAPAETPQYNWGYDPEHYNVPEGSYATNAYDGGVRIREFKQAIQALHANGIRVVMDVVYNHTGATETSVFNQTVPGYYYRQNKEGGFSDASACGNETASERAMVRKYIVESVKYWATEYHIDGFRFDLMGIHDIETMNQVSAALHAIDPTIFIYGEGWTAGASPLPDSLRALKVNTHRLNKIAAFSDDFRDGLKGSVFDHHDRGFVSGKSGMEESIKFGIAASVKHPQIDYTKVNYSKAPWAAEPYQTITYVECHDNHTLWDKLAISCPDATEEERIKMQKLAMTMVLTAQGVPFIHAGAEMLRTKNGVENSFKSPDAINSIDWGRKTTHAAFNRYITELIQLRKSHPAFRLGSAELIRRHLNFLNTDKPGVIAYQLGRNAGGDSWGRIVVILNPTKEKQFVGLPKGNWTVVLDEHQIKESGIRAVLSPRVDVAPVSALILVE